MICHFRILDYLIDQAMLIQGPINVYHLNTFNEGSVYEFPDPMERFRFCDYGHHMSLANTNTGFPDLVGEVRGIKTIYNEETQIGGRLFINASSGRLVRYEEANEKESGSFQSSPKLGIKIKW
ncbi:hypothetical protein HA466_0246610 [Hirschfeldia incana]|nr:hypothetical protein HA466_0246610 [Hirschfeldia incana]